MLSGRIDCTASESYNLYFILRSVLNELSTSPNEIKVSFIETLFIQSILLIHFFYSFFTDRTPLFSPGNIWHCASQCNQSTIDQTQQLTPLNTQPESAVCYLGKFQRFWFNGDKNLGHLHGKS